MLARRLCASIFTCFGLIFLNQCQAQAGVYDGSTYVYFNYSTATNLAHEEVDPSYPTNGSYTTTGVAGPNSIIFLDSKQSVEQNGLGYVDVYGDLDTHTTTDFFWDTPTPLTDPAPDVVPSYGYACQSFITKAQANGANSYSDLYYETYYPGETALGYSPSTNGTTNFSTSFGHNGYTTSGSFTTEQYLHLHVAMHSDAGYPPSSSAYGSAKISSNSTIAVVLTNP